MSDSQNKQAKADEIAEGIVRGVGMLAQRVILAVTLSIAAFAGLFFVSNSGFYLGKDDYADVDNGGAQRERVTGRGFHFTNPLKTAGVWKWSPVNQTLTIPSAPDDQKDVMKVDVDTRFYDTGESSFRTEEGLRVALGTGQAKLRELFEKNAWSAYAAVDPAKNPENARKVCDELTSVMTHAMQFDLRDAKVTGCRITISK